MRATRTELRYEAIAAVAFAVLIFFAYRIVGFLGVGILGLATMFIAVQADLGKSDSSHLYAMRGAQPDRMDHAEKAARRAEANALAHPILMGKCLGLCLAIIGFAGLYFL